jgi:preprotein translocase subunit SecD
MPTHGLWILVTCLALLPAHPRAAEPSPDTLLRLTFEVTDGHADPGEIQAQGRRVLRRRVEAYGLTGGEVTDAGGGGLQVEAPSLPGAAEVLTSRGCLRVFLVDDEVGTYERLSPLPDGVTVQIRQRDGHTCRELEGTNEEALRDFLAARLPTDRRAAYAVDLRHDGGGFRFSATLLRGEPVLQSDAIRDATTSMTNGADGVDLVLNARGTRILKEFTRRNKGARLAVVIDDELVHTACILQPFVGGLLRVTRRAWRSNLSPKDLARAYAAVLRSPLPEPLVLRSLERIAP